MAPTDWLRDAVLYQIYPPSFADSDGDGIGDLRGMIDRLDYLQWLGITAVWLNPCFDSPFRDGGYDVSDYLRVAPRYGTNDDLIEFMAEARSRGIRVLLDLVAGHTSTEHGWFRAALRDRDDHRYIWSEDPPDSAHRFPGDGGWVPSPGPRRGYYLKNFYDSQPALNFGYAQPDPAEPWRHAPDDEGPRRNRRALRDIMDFWLRRGASGFRVDMAYSLVKADPDLSATTAIWRELREWLDATYPEAVIVPEGMDPPSDSPPFHGDFVLVISPEHGDLFANGGAGWLPWADPAPCFFDAAGEGDTSRFLTLWRQRQQAMGADRPILLASSDHDYSRLRSGGRSLDQLGVALAFLLTWPGVPSIYYGDEIGMRYLPGLPDHEGSICHPTYNRAGVRTPMQWSDGPTAGFSGADPDSLYLPIDPSPDRPTVAAQRDEPGSVLQICRRLIRLRRDDDALRAGGRLDVLNDGYPLVYLRRGTRLVVVNPAGSARWWQAPAELATSDWRLLEGAGARFDADGSITVEAFGFGVWARG